MRKIFILLILCFLFLFLSYGKSFAGTYWVDPSGATAWASCQSATDPGSGYCSLATACSNVVAGDVVKLKGGNYNAELRLSSRSGSAGNYITFEAASGETPIVEPTSSAKQALGLSNSDYIKIIGIRFEYNVGNTSGYLLYIVNASDHIELDSDIFDGNGLAGAYASMRYGTSGVQQDAIDYAVSHIWVHDSQFIKIGDPNNGCSDDNGLQLGLHTAQTYSGNVTFEDNIFYGGGHHNFESYFVRVAFRNNVMHNEAYDTGSCACPGSARTARAGLFGNRNVQFLGCNGTGTLCNTYNLIEGNRSGFAEETSDGSQEGNFTISGPRMIVRYNKSFYSETNGLYFKYVAERNCVYNNTFYKDGQDSNGSCNNSDWHNVIREQCAGTSCAYNNVKNNIFDNPATGAYYKYWDKTQYFSNNFCSYTDADAYDDGCSVQNGTAAFDDTSLADPTSTTSPSLNLTASSGAIDQGSYLTQANGSGSSSTTLIVDNSNYFQCGSSCATTPVGADMSNIQADWISIGTVGNIVQISDINHSTNTITLASAMTWADNANIWLYKKSDGTRVLYGSAPDQGASEYGSSDSTAPANTISSSDPQIIYGNSLTLTGTCTDEFGVTGVKYRLSSAPDASNGTTCTCDDGTCDGVSEAWTCTATTGYSNGSNTMYVGCTDAYANWGSGDSITVNYYPISTHNGFSIINGGIQ